MDGDGVMVGANDTKISDKSRFGKLAVGNKKDKDVEGRERRRGGGGGIAMDAIFYQRYVLLLVHQFLRFLLAFDEH